MASIPQEFDYTMLSTFLTCRKKYWWRMVRHLVGMRAPIAADFGKAIHAALDEWYKDKNVDKAIDVFKANYKEDSSDDKRTYAVGTKMLQLYHMQYQYDRFEVLGTEVDFSLPLAEDGVRYIGRIDKIIKWDGATYVLDHKTTSRLGAEFFNKIKPNMQFDGYVWAARQIGHPTCSGVVMDALLVAKGLLVPSQLARLNPVGRDISPRSDMDIARWRRNISSIIDDLMYCYEADEWYENSESCCDFVECPYRKLCKEDDDIREDIAESEYRVEVWSPRRGENTEKTTSLP